MIQEGTFDRGAWIRDTSSGITLWVPVSGKIRETLVDQQYFAFFRGKRRGAHTFYYACPRGCAVDHGDVCARPMILHAILHPREELFRLVGEIRGGVLTQRRAPDLQRAWEIINRCAPAMRQVAGSGASW